MIAKLRKKRKVQSSQNRSGIIVFGIVFLLIGGFLVVTNVNIHKRRTLLKERIETLSGKIQELEEKKSVLQEEILGAGSQEYLEKAAREQFNLKKPGEEVVIITWEQGQKEEKKEKEREEKTSWNPKSWWEWIKGKVRD